MRRLGFAAEEGEIALLSRTSSARGTEPDLLADALRARYGKQGLVCDYRYFRSLADLKAAGLTLAVVKFNFFLDHYVAVLRFTRRGVVVGDPLSGEATWATAEFVARAKKLKVGNGLDE